jgi:hypothetical protein
LDAGVRISTVDTRQMNQTVAPAVKSAGLIGVDREEIVDNRLRRYYRLTPDGEKRLAFGQARRTPIVMLMVPW